MIFARINFIINQEIQHLNILLLVILAPRNSISNPHREESEMEYSSSFFSFSSSKSDENDDKDFKMRMEMNYKFRGSWLFLNLSFFFHAQHSISCLIMDI